MNRTAALVIALIAVTGLVVWLVSGNTHAFGTTEGSANVAYSVTVLVLVLTSLILNWRGSLTDGVRYAAIWLGLFVALILGYSYRDNVKEAWQRVAGELNPAMPIERSGKEVTLRRADDGHFYVDTVLNGTSIRMLADTGATTISLSEDDARRIGIDVSALDYAFTVSTANGEAPAAEVMLETVRVGPIVRHNVRALVGRDLFGSLLGMNFFSSLSKFTMESDQLVLKD